jgi:hypothetical protein
MKSIAGVVHHPGGRWANLQSPSGGGTLTASSSSSQVGMPAGGSFLRLEQVKIIWDLIFTHLCIFYIDRYQRYLYKFFNLFTIRGFEFTNSDIKFPSEWQNLQFIY